MTQLRAAFMKSPLKTKINGMERLQHQNLLFQLSDKVFTEKLEKEEETKKLINNLWERN